jgi:secondary thiamine-phosphate synthase enzyme
MPHPCTRPALSATIRLTTGRSTLRWVRQARLNPEVEPIMNEVRSSAIKSVTEYLVFETKRRREMVHITDQVEKIVRNSGIKDGLCFVSPMHITAAIYVNDHEDGLIEDIGKWLEELAPARSDYKHHRTGEDNGDAHLKSLLLHHETTLPVTNGKLDLGTWQRIFYAEFDGQRRKRVIVKVMGLE